LNSLILIWEMRGFMPFPANKIPEEKSMSTENSKIANLTSRTALLLALALPGAALVSGCNKPADPPPAETTAPPAETPPPTDTAPVPATDPSVPPPADPNAPPTMDPATPPTPTDSDDAPKPGS
jgi:hypothetical protein